MRTSLVNHRSFNCLTAVAAALIAAFGASQAHAGVVVAIDPATDYSTSAPAGGYSSQPAPPDGDDAARRELLKALLASSPADGGMTNTSTTLASGSASSPAVVDFVSDLPQPVLIAWLSVGQYLSLPSLPPSGLFRPPRAA